MIAPLVQWAGAKRWHVPMVASHWAGERVVELFCGSAAITFGLQPSHAVLNDANPHLINLYRHVQRGMTFDDVVLVNDEQAYYAHREWFNALIANGHTSSAEAAQLFYFLNHHGFNGLCRFNQSGEFNVPYRHRAKYYCPVPDVSYQLSLAPYTFLCGDFGDVPLEADDLVYADPPYDDTFTDYNAGGFSFEDQERVALLLREHPGRVFLMNAGTPRILKLYTSMGYHVTMVQSAPKDAAQPRPDRLHTGGHGDEFRCGIMEIPCCVG